MIHIICVSLSSRTLARKLKMDNISIWNSEKFASERFGTCGDHGTNKDNGLYKMDIKEDSHNLKRVRKTKLQHQTSDIQNHKINWTRNLFLTFWLLTIILSSWHLPPTLETKGKTTLWNYHDLVIMVQVHFIARKINPKFRLISSS